MRLRTTLGFLAALLAANLAPAAGNQTALALDLARKNTAISLTWTEYCDNAVLAAVLRGGEEFPVAGWDVALVLGGTTSGCVVEGIAAGYNTVLFDIPASSIPTNGRYTVQINAMKDRRSEEWGRGSLRVNVNNGVSYMPTCWMGYQKVARLAASMLTMEFITNEVFTAVLTNVSVRVDLSSWTNACIGVESSAAAGIPERSRFVWDGSNAVSRVFRSHNLPGGAFTLPQNLAIATSSFALGGETFLPQKVDGRWWYCSTSNPARRFMVKLAFVGDGLRNRYLNGE